MYVDGQEIKLGLAPDYQPEAEEVAVIEMVTDRSLEEIAVLGRQAGQQACGAAECCLDVKVERYTEEYESGDGYTHHTWPAARINVLAPGASSKGACSPPAQIAVSRLAGIFSEAFILNEIAEHEATVSLSAGDREAAAILEPAQTEAEAVLSRAQAAADTVRARVYGTLRKQLDEPTAATS